MTRSGAASDTAIVNALTVDVEDYFHVSAFDSVVARSEWSSFESRVAGNTERLLTIFRDAGVRATFFVLGWVAERAPRLVRTIAAEGHEIASHGYAHQLLYRLGPQSFREDLRRARHELEHAAGAPVVGYRAPSFSVTAESLWALDVLIEEGYLYDASIFPVHHDRYGIPAAPRHCHRIERPGGAIWEVPASTIRRGGINLPVGGGGYFRLLPYAWTRWGIATLNTAERQPAVFYVHPWEIDADQPRIPAPVLSRWRHYTGLARTERRLHRLVADFRFGPLISLLEPALDFGALRFGLPVAPPMPRPAPVTAATAV